jgi:hypothetical protein
MAVYLVTWELNRERPNYAQARQALVAQLEKFPHTRDAGLDSVWSVSTDWSADQVSDYVRRSLDSNDRLLVTKMVSGNHQGWMSEPVWKWINQRL